MKKLYIKTPPDSEYLYLSPVTLFKSNILSHSIITLKNNKN